MNPSILLEANEIQMRFKKDQLSSPKEVTEVTIYRRCRSPKWDGNRVKVRQNRWN
jgi:hypothetical protein